MADADTAVLALTGAAAAAAAWLSHTCRPELMPGQAATRSAGDWAASRPRRAGAMVVFNGPSSAGKSTLVTVLQQRLAARRVPLSASNVYLKVAYDDLDVLLPENALPDLFVWENGEPTLRQPGESGAGGKHAGELGFNGCEGTAVYWFEDRSAGQGHPPQQAIVNHPCADACLRGQHRAWVSMCGAGNNLLVDHWLQEPWWHTDLHAAIREAAVPPSNVLFVHVACPVTELERRESSRGDRVLGTSRWSAEHGNALRHGGHSDLELDSGGLSTEQMAAEVEAAMVHKWGLLDG